MENQSLSSVTSQNRVMEEAALRIEGEALGNMKEQGAAVMELLETAAVITDPELGGKIDILD